VRQVSDKSATDPLPQQASPVHLRRAQPALTLLPRTAVWISLLPKPIRPIALALQFARIANHVCAVWDDPAACRRYLDELLTDDRGGRAGFHAAMLHEIETLKAYHAHVFPTSEFGPDQLSSKRVPWDASDRN
ncbi:MAG: hypothetical protein ABI624_21445, partial [Casimicrobiaceae bacterium]